MWRRFSRVKTPETRAKQTQDNGERWSQTYEKTKRKRVYRCVGSGLSMAESGYKVIVRAVSLTVGDSEPGVQFTII